ncbi:MAG: hypothetical protein K1X33_06415 [Methanobacteriaceae archaeon]|nr:hypothetical protein [Methanobacteriaceae archaeon]
MNKNYYIYDIETLKSCFTYTGLNIDTAEIKTYVLHKDKFELHDLIQHLETVKYGIGFNNIFFDYPVLHFIIENYKYFNTISKEDVIHAIYRESQRIINLSDDDFSSRISYKNFKMPQLDLYKIWHYNNKGRRTSLKSLQISMNFPNVMEMPLEHTKDDITLEEVSDILKYNLNDVIATFEFYKLSKDKIKLRTDISKAYKIPALNYSDSKIGETIIFKEIIKKTGIDSNILKSKRTYRNKIVVKDILFDNIKFETPELKQIHSFFKDVIIYPGTKNNISKSILFKNVLIDYGIGGIHGITRAGIYESDNDYVIMSADVASLYPNIGIKYKLYPEHLGSIFCDIYSNILDKRIKAKNLKNNILSDALKLALNATYGKSNEVNSFLYDPQYTMSITINGQLLMSMLVEKLSCIPDSQIYMINTDGLEIKIPRIYKEMYFNICKEWEKITKFTLEYNEYNKISIADVNNYSCIDTNSKIKNKGRFEIDKLVGSEPAYHKDNSFKIIPIALENYIYRNIPIEDTIRNHTNIYDFCGRQKFTKDSHGEIHSIAYRNGIPEHVKNITQKNTRYYISTKGNPFIKCYSKGSTEKIHVGFLVQEFNNYVEKQISDYNINYSFYINEVNKELNNIKPRQLDLFI